MPQNLADALRRWVQTIPELLDDTVGPDGQRRALNPARIFPYAFRHAYAQRHADAGVAIDVLRDLMDHSSVSTTQGYYRVTARRKREAVTAIRHQVVDRRRGDDAAVGDRLRAAVGSGPVRRLHRTEQRQGRRRFLPDQIPMLGLRVLPR